MKTKTAPAMTVLAKEMKTTMKNMLTDVGDIPQEIVKHAVNNGLHPSGPQYWIYEWNEENPTDDSEFKLTVTLPVATFGADYKATEFELKTLDTFKHISEIHLGAWDKLKDTYGKLMEEMGKQKLIPGKTCREIYINCDFEKPENNITEVQFELN